MNVLLPSTSVGVGRVVECSGERFIVPCPRPVVVNHSRILSGPHQVLPSSSLSPSERPQQGARRARATCERLACMWVCKKKRKACVCVFISQIPQGTSSNHSCPSSSLSLVAGVLSDLALLFSPSLPASLLIFFVLRFFKNRCMKIVRECSGLEILTPE